jgi:SAM-dependent methyltransferase
MRKFDHGPVQVSGGISLTNVTPPNARLMADAFRCSPAVLHDKIGGWSQAGWAPKQRLRFGHLTPADWYESLLDAIVTPQTVWLDVGCGRDLSPGNVATGRRLADRCRKLVGIDPSDNIDDNPFVHERLKMPIEAHPPGPAYDLITLRMVAEHVEAPEKVAKQLTSLLLPGGRIVIYTVGRYSPSVIVAASTPLWVHHAVKQVLWRTEERDTFPTVYRMNTRQALRRLFCGEGLSEVMFEYLGDCRTTARFKFLQYFELSIWKILSLIRFPYPEACILAMYQSA